jgi:nucleoside-diphosphate-sugar epimerase
MATCDLPPATCDLQMRIFLTGGTGYIGGAVAASLRARQHEVTALTRAESDSHKLRDLGVVIVAGDLASLPSLHDTLEQHDVIVHCAQSNENAEELTTIAMNAYADVRAHLIYTSGVWVLGNTTSADENTPIDPLAIVKWRPAQEERAIAKGGAVIRPGCVYGAEQSLLRDWFASIERNEAIHLVGDGNNRWAMVNLHDLADCYVRAVETRATGILHGIDDTHATLAECVRALNGDVRIETTPVEVARQKFGPFADALAIDQVISSEETRKKIGWIPKRDFISSVDEQWREWRSLASETDQ